MSFDPRAWSIRRKLYSLSAGLLVCMLGQVGFSAWQGRLVAAGVADLNAYAARENTVADAQTALETARRAVLDFAGAGDEKALRLFRGKLDALQGLVAGADVAGPLEKLRDVGEALAKAVARRAADQEQMAPAGEELANSGKMMATVVLALDKPTLALSAQKLDSLMLQIRVDNWSGQATRNAEGLIALQDDTSHAAQQLAMFEAEAGDDVKDFIAPMKTALATYAATADDTLKAIVEVEDLNRGKIAPLVEAMQTTLGAQTARAAADFEATRAAVAATIYRAG